MQNVHANLLHIRPSGSQDISTILSVIFDCTKASTELPVGGAQSILSSRGFSCQKTKLAFFLNT